ncbi:hypothetical protein H2200_005340 [Cladophialophora chaetospira]|uniref:Uncharacterized protein n=1 Tax=Cladophialophora chaetospira TaxID=386627 RepID=A0AA38XBT0_9EURO|nr:hypothetical protein H2200_005340 [Cladophialophora chaetospira]
MAMPITNIQLQHLPQTVPLSPSNASSTQQLVATVPSPVNTIQNSTTTLSTSAVPLLANTTSNSSALNAPHPISTKYSGVASLLWKVAVLSIKCIFAIGAMIVAVLALYQSLWSSAKDYRDDCRSVNETYGYTSSDCATVLKESLRRPWGLDIFVSKPEGENRRFRRDEFRQDPTITDRTYEIGIPQDLLGVLFLLLGYLGARLASWYHRPRGFATGPGNDYRTSRIVPSTTGLRKSRFELLKDNCLDTEPDWNQPEGLQTLPTTTRASYPQDLSLCNQWNRGTLAPPSSSFDATAEERHGNIDSHEFPLDDLDGSTKLRQRAVKRPTMRDEISLESQPDFSFVLREPGFLHFGGVWELVSHERAHVPVLSPHDLPGRWYNRTEPQ